MAIGAGRLFRLLRSLVDDDSAGELLVYDDADVLGYHRLDRVRDAHGAVWTGGALAVASAGANEVL